MSDIFDLDSLKNDFFRTTKNIEFTILSCEFSNSYELKNLKKPKTSFPKYTVSFFCKKANEWFIVKVIYDIKDANTLLNKKSLFNKLMIGARTMYELKKKTKNPFKYFSDINIETI